MKTPRLTTPLRAKNGIPIEVALPEGFEMIYEGTIQKGDCIYHWSDTNPRWMQQHKGRDIGTDVNMWHAVCRRK